jgi:hypothetical protein
MAGDAQPYLVHVTFAFDALDAADAHSALDIYLTTAREMLTRDGWDFPHRIGQVVEIDPNVIPSNAMLSASRQQLPGEPDEAFEDYLRERDA